MLTHASLLCRVRKNNWFTSADLRDMYFHIFIHPPHRKYLRYAFQGICSLKHFLPSLMGHHALMRPDNTMTVAHIKHQGGCAPVSCGRLLSLKAMHVPDALNTGAYLLSRGTPVYEEWTLQPEIVEQIWVRPRCICSRRETESAVRAVLLSAQHGCSPWCRRECLAAQVDLCISSPGLPWQEWFNLLRWHCHSVLFPLYKMLGPLPLGH